MNLARIIIISGLLLVAVGVVLYLAARVGLPLGRLPGDIRIEREGFSCFFPLATMLLISLVLTLLVNILGRIIR